MLTLSNHQPFDWDFNVDVSFFQSEKNSRVYNNYLAGINYTDLAFGQFLRDFKSSDLYDSTLLIVTGDHGVPFYSGLVDQESEGFKVDVLYKVPLIIHDGKNIGVNENLFSHLDFAPTVMKFLNIASENSFLGRSVNDIYLDKPVILMGMNDFGVVYKNSRCHGFSIMSRNFVNNICEIEDDNMLDVIEDSKSLVKYLNFIKIFGYKHMVGDN
ncbi:sulfatase-like hydrolase/transferase [Shewanella sp. NIFS-20-20]|nr:sulfatase-like hydrolase/transferase [Shewanella sp. NIFS-20-20]